MTDRTNNLSEADGSAFSSLDQVGQCLMDRARSEAFDRAIRVVVKSHHIVLDAGTGSGLLALFAARAGARRVIALEYDPYIAALARANIRANGYENVIEVIEADAHTYQFDPALKFDVVIAEMLTTGCIDEFQVQAMNNLHRQGVVTPTTAFIPERQDTFVALAETNFEVYGLNFPIVRHLWEELSEQEEVKLLTDRKPLNGIEFAGGAAGRMRRRSPLHRRTVRHSKQPSPHQPYSANVRNQSRIHTGLKRTCHHSYP